jgi:hypothetical protein
MEFNNKIYKNLKSFRSAQTRFRNKLIKHLNSSPEITDEIQSQLQALLEEQFKSKQEAKKRPAELSKSKRQMKKLGLPNFISVNPTTKKSRGERLQLREDEIKKYKKEVENIDFRTKNIIKKKALNIRITEDFIDDNLDDIEERNNIIISRIMVDLRKAQDSRLSLKCDLTLRFIVVNTSDEEQIRYARSSVMNIFTKNDILLLLENLMAEYDKVLENTKNASNLIFKKYMEISIHSIRQSKMKIKAGKYIQESDAIRNSKSIINIKNLDERCVTYRALTVRL